jgi:sulfhydrogenase subunit delta
MSASKTKIAFFDFTGCEGCQLAVIDCLQIHPELLEAVEIVQFREAISEHGEDYQIAFIEGSCTRSQDEARLQKIRAQADMVIALGACAHLGGINALRNWQALATVRRTVYGEIGNFDTSYAARPISAIIPVDASLPGCPINPQEFVHTVKRLLLGLKPKLPDCPVCVECKLNENLCLVMQGQACLGAIVRAGCGALCPSFGIGCAGCRGFISNPNLSGLQIALQEHGLQSTEVTAKEHLFMSYTLMESEA